MPFVWKGVLVFGQNFHNPMVDQEAVPISRVSMLPDKLKADFSILSAGWVCFFLYLPFHHIYIKFPNSAVGFCGASNGGWRKASSVIGGQTPTAMVKYVLKDGPWKKAAAFKLLRLRSHMIQILE